MLRVFLITWCILHWIIRREIVWHWKVVLCNPASRSEICSDVAVSPEWIYSATTRLPRRQWISHFLEGFITWNCICCFSQSKWRLDRHGGSLQRVFPDALGKSVIPHWTTTGIIMSFLSRKKRDGFNTLLEDLNGIIYSAHLLRSELGGAVCCELDNCFVPWSHFLCLLRHWISSSIIFEEKRRNSPKGKKSRLQQLFDATTLTGWNPACPTELLRTRQKLSSEKRSWLRFGHHWQTQNKQKSSHASLRFQISRETRILLSGRRNSEGAIGEHLIIWHGRRIRSCSCSTMLWSTKLNEKEIDLWVFDCPTIFSRQKSAFTARVADEQNRKTESFHPKRCLSWRDTTRKWKLFSPTSNELDWQRENGSDHLFSTGFGQN